MTGSSCTLPHHSKPTILVDNTKVISFPQHRLQSLQVDQQPRTDLDRKDLSLSLNNGMLPVQEVPTLFFRVSTRERLSPRALPLPAAAGMKLSSTDMLPCRRQFRVEMHAGCKWRRAELRRLLCQYQRCRFAAQMRGAFQLNQCPWFHDRPLRTRNQCQMTWCVPQQGNACSGLQKTGQAAFSCVSLLRTAGLHDTLAKIAASATLSALRMT